VNLPNLLTLGRLVSVPVLMALLLTGFPGHDQLAAALFLVASLTDTLDGQLARRRRQVTELGKFLDPFVDKVFILSVLIVLVQQRALPAWVVVLIFGRELLITVLRSVSAAQGHVIAATPWGKTKTVTQVGAVLVLILEQAYPAIAPAGYFAIGVAVVFTVLSGIDYLWRFRHVFTRMDAELAWRWASPGGGSPGAASPVDPLARELGERLTAKRLTLAVAESCTGGLVAALVTDQPGSSAYFLGGVVSYSDAAKRDLLGVPEELLRREGAVSEPVAKAMAAAARERFGSDLAASVTGVAGPGAPGSSKPVGLTFVGVASHLGTRVSRFEFAGDRWRNRRRAAEECLRLVLEEAARLDERTAVR
jgi:CDP-diacylglycerol--glycerol-3-phosphate 3-phosphatidyltransferase